MKLEIKQCNKGGAARLLTALALALTLGTAAADSEQARYSLAVIKDAAKGRAILSENYHRAIDGLEAKKARGIRGFYIANNLCVAYVKSGQLDESLRACGLAVDLVDGLIGPQTPAGRNPVSAGTYRKYLAIALSNRGVAYAVNGSYELARGDFTAAIAVRADLNQPETNLARLELVAPPTA